jgi:hypothetical protein
LRGEVFRERVEAAGIDRLVAALGEHRRHAVTGVAERVAVGIVRPQATDDFVGRKLVVHVDESRDQRLGAPEEMIGPLEALGRIAFAAEEIRLPRRVGGDARHLVDLAGVGDRVHGVRRMCDHHQVDLAGVDQFVRHFGGAVGIGLAVLDDDLDRVGLVADLDAVGDRLLELAQHEAVRLGEDRERTGRRRHQSDLDGADLRAQHGRRHCQQRGSAAGFQNLPAVGRQ